MTEFQALLDQLGWSRDFASRKIGKSFSLVRHWALGVNSRGNPCSAPAPVMEWLRGCVAAVEAVPRP